MSDGLDANQRTKIDFLIEDAHRAGEQATTHGEAAQKALFLANGASIISLLTFLGNSSARYEPVGIFWAFVWFSLGVTAAIFSQYSLFKLLVNNRLYSFFVALKELGEDTGSKVSDFGDLSDNWRKAATWTTMISLILFVTGVFVALHALLP